MKLLVKTKQGEPVLIETNREKDYMDKYLNVDGTPFITEDVVEEKPKKAGRPKGSKNVKRKIINKKTSK